MADPLVIAALDRMLASVDEDLADQDPGNHATIGQLVGEKKGLQAARELLMRAQPEALSAEPRWRDTKVVVPCDGEDVLGYWRAESNFGKIHVGTVHYFHKAWHAVGEPTHACGIPDFWVPLPPSPQLATTPTKEKS